MLGGQIGGVGGNAHGTCGLVAPNLLRNVTI